MHEMSLVRQVVRVVLQECEGKGVTRVVRVNLAVGEPRDVVDEYVPDLFAHLSRGTVCEGAQVSIRRIPLTVRCSECGDIFPISAADPASWACPRCGAYQRYKIFSGDEFAIEAIEGVANGDKGEYSGWIYNVNGEMPMDYCDKLEVNDGDEIVWSFSEGL